MSEPELRVRTYGAWGPTVFVLHGGPGAPGYVAPVARGLADLFRVVEPFQRPSRPDESGLTVARHVADLHVLIASLGADARPALVGHSWGAMLALAFAAEHPDAAGPIVLVGCGTFDLESRRVFKQTVDDRMAERDLKRRMDRLAEEYPDENDRLRAMGSSFTASTRLILSKRKATTSAPTPGSRGRRGTTCSGFRRRVSTRRRSRGCARRC